MSILRTHGGTILVLLLALLSSACGDKVVVSPTADELAQDPDGDGITTGDELTARIILVDETGFGFGEGEDFGAIQEREVTSDPYDADTDDDGLDDGVEFSIRTDPRRADTDGDELTDEAEWNRWFTSPVSVDSDGDARGPAMTTSGGAPNAFLFDGEELKRGMSPTLADTDGDGASDFEEIDHRFRNPLIAELPVVDVEVEGEIDVRLFVEYSEERGTEISYGTSTTTTSGTSVTESSETSETTSFEWSLGGSLGLEGKSGGGSLSGGIGGGTSSTTTRGFSTESTQELSQESSRQRTDSVNKTETAARGEIKVGLRIANGGTSLAFRVTNLAITVRQWQPSADGTEPAGSFKTLATLLPVVSSFTLAPGERSNVIEVQTGDVNPSVLKEFLARPSSLIFEPAAFDLENAEGIDFNFLTENTFAQTALVEIDFGNGTVERHRVATNVKRGQGGTFEGITMEEVMSDILEIPFETSSITYTPFGAATSVTREALYAVRGETDDIPPAPARPRRLWRVVGSRDDLIPADANFRDITLQAGDQITLVYVRDEDQDGLSNLVEEIHGTLDETTDPAIDPTDTDGDGLGDYEEVVEGWMAGIERDATGQPTPGFQPPFGYPRRVYPNPTLFDTDEDDLSDAEEAELRTDPTNPDTDADGFRDGADLFPLVPTRRLYVDKARTYPHAGELGSSWRNAYSNIQDAVAAAVVTHDALEMLVDAALPPGSTSTTLPEKVDEVRAANGGVLSDGILTASRDYVGELWVADGLYFPDEGAQGMSGDPSRSFELVDGLAWYGGFQGVDDPGDPADVGEQKRDARDPDPLSNGTVLSGRGVATHVVTADGVSRSARLDGFLVEGGAAGDPSFESTSRGGGVFMVDSSPTIHGCAIVNNTAVRGGGGIYALRGAPLVEDSVLANNHVVEYMNGPTIGGGGGLFAGCNGARVTGTTIASNTTPFYFTRHGSLTITAGNGASKTYPDPLPPKGNNPSDTTNCPISWSGEILGVPDQGHGGGVYLLLCTNTTLRHCTFQNNAAHIGAGLSVSASDPTQGIPSESNVVDRCRFIRNSTSPASTWSFEWWRHYALDIDGRFIIECNNSSAIIRIQNLFAAFEVLIARGGLLDRMGGGIFSACDTLTVSQCIFEGNEAVTGAGVAWATGNTSIVNCTFTGDRAEIGGQVLFAPALSANQFNPTGLVQNCVVEPGPMISWGEQDAANWDVGDPGMLEEMIYSAQFGPAIRVSSCLFTQDPLLYGGTGNIFTPMAALEGPFLTPGNGSPAIDAGIGFLDFQPDVPGFQGAPDEDFRGNPRVVDADGDGVDEIDIGATERQDDAP